MSPYERIREIIESIPDRSESGFSPVSHPELYSQAVRELQSILSTSHEADLVDFIDELSHQKGYESAAHLFSYKIN